MQRIRSASVVAVVLIVAVLAAAAPLPAQDAQSRLWDSAISGDTVSLLQALAAGAKVDSLDLRSNPNGRRALNWAAWNNRVPVIRILAARGAPVNATNLSGFTPLHHAAESGSMEAALALLAAGADPLRVTNDGEIAADVARRKGFTAIADSIDAAARRR
jgi:ankyrin repeat protein